MDLISSLFYEHLACRENHKSCSDGFYVFFLRQGYKKCEIFMQSEDSSLTKHQKRLSSKGSVALPGKGSVQLQ